MADPLSTSVAVAVTTGATAALSDGVRVLVTRLAAALRERFGRGVSDQATLEEAIRDGEAKTVQRLAELIGERMREDPAFANQIRTLWRELVEEQERSEVTNTVHGEVHGSVVQARDVSGGIRFGSP